MCTATFAGVWISYPVLGNKCFERNLQQEIKLRFSFILQQLFAKLGLFFS
jgi:hypothetical protein